jgi:predicted neutral ceramidase superfamily lipid hydrolase
MIIIEVILGMLINVNMCYDADMIFLLFFVEYIVFDSTDSRILLSFLRLLLIFLLYGLVSFFAIEVN